MDLSSIIALILFPSTIVMTGFSMGIFRRAHKNWYDSIKKSSLTPPPIVFPIVWTTLYFLIGISGWVFWERNKNFKKEDSIEWIFYFLQLAINFSYSPILFLTKNIFLTFIVSILMEIAIIFNIYFFFMKSSLAGLLLVPYVIWITIATYLIFDMWKINRKLEKKE